MKLSERLDALKRMPATAQTMGNLLAFTLGMAIAAFILAAMALLNAGVRNAN